MLILHLLFDREPSVRRRWNCRSKTVLENCFVEDAVDYNQEERYQFIRNGYFCLDSVDSTPEKLVFNRTITLKDTKKVKIN